MGFWANDFQGFSRRGGGAIFSAGVLAGGVWTPVPLVFSGSGLGTVVGVQAFAMRISDSMVLRGKFTVGTVTSGPGYFALPYGLLPDVNNKTPSGNFLLGEVTTATASSDGVRNTASLSWINGDLKIGITNVGGGADPNNLITAPISVIMSTGGTYAFQTQPIPIAGWAAYGQE